jgi:SnoaL-like domain
MQPGVEDSASVRELYSRVAFAQDTGDIDAWIESFCPDGGLELPSGAQIIGHDALRAFALPRREELKSLTHMISNVVLEKADAGIAGRAYYLCLKVSSDAKLLIRAFGTYHDTFKQVDGHWRLYRRRLCSELPANLVDATLASSGAQ